MTVESDRLLAILETAYNAPNGVKLVFKDDAARHAYRMKLYTRRQLDRRETARAYNKPISPGISPYDSLSFIFYREPDGRPGIHILRVESEIEFLDKDGDPVELKYD